MDTALKDVNGTPLRMGDTVATAMVSRSAGRGLRQGIVVTPAMFRGCIVVKLADSGREVSRRWDELVKVAM